MTITPHTKIGELLEAHPELEDVLLELSPKFHHLKNPMIRKTVAQMATLQQAAQLANLSVEYLINRLQNATEKNLKEDQTVSSNDNIEPDWFNTNNIADTLNISHLIESGQHPLGLVLNRLELLPQGKILQLIAPFYPAPLIDIVKGKKFKIYCKNAGNETVIIYFFKP